MKELNGKIKHVAIIMDGNNRWRKKNDLSLKDGYNAGIFSAERAIKYALNNGISYLTLYAFSTENWKRDSNTVTFLINIFSDYFQKNIFDIINNNDIEVTFIGDLSIFSKKMQKQMKIIESVSRKKKYDINKFDNTNTSSFNNDKNILFINKYNEKKYNEKENPKLRLKIAMNYGGQEEILNAAEKLVEKRLKEFLKKKFDCFISNFDNLNYSKDSLCDFFKFLDNYSDEKEVLSNKNKKNKQISQEITIKNILEKDSWPYPDLLIRTGGQMRLSNFLLWYISYTELYFVDVLWPDFDEKCFDKAICDFNKRVRNFGG